MARQVGKGVVHGSLLLAGRAEPSASARLPVMPVNRA